MQKYIIVNYKYNNDNILYYGNNIPITIIYNMTVFFN